MRAHLGLRVRWTRNEPCPYCAAADQMERIWKLHVAWHGGLDPEQPLFPDADGCMVLKHHVVEVVEAVATMAGRLIKTPDGRRAYGGHVFRVSGARMLARRGLPEDMIMLLARWESEIIRHYCKEAPLHGLTATYMGQGDRCVLPAIRDRCMPNPQPGLAEHKPFSCKVLARAKRDALDARKQVDDLAAELKALSDEFRRVQAKPSLVIGRNGLGAVHVALDYGEVQPGFWRTRCGWRYGNSQFLRASNPNSFPPGRLCEKCFPGVDGQEWGPRIRCMHV